jgi:hypothetical protein
MACFTGTIFFGGVEQAKRVLELQGLLRIDQQGSETEIGGVLDLEVETPIVLPGPIFVLGDTDPTIEETQKLLARFGYGVSPSGYFDGTTRDAVAAFQRHFRPARVDGILDISTLTTLKTLVSERDAKMLQARAG